MTNSTHGAIIRKEANNSDRGRASYEYSVGCDRHRRTQRKGASAEEIKELYFYFWAYGKEPYDCQHTKLESYRIYNIQQCRLDQLRCELVFLWKGEQMAIFKGAGVAIVTPMHADGSVNFEKLEETIDYQIENGTDSIVICGTTGESSTLSEEEHIECIRTAISRTAGRIPVIAGTGSNSTETAIYLTKEAEEAGADGALVVTPYYNKATQKGLVAHYTEIAKHTDMPIILYNVQSRTGVNIAPETAVTLAKTCDNIVGIKEASGNISQIATLMQLADGCIDLYSGNDDEVVPILSLGGIGVISVFSNICPRDSHDIVAKYLAGDVKGSLEMQLKALPLMHELFNEVNPIPVKAAMNLLGMNVGPLRMPLSEIEPEHKARLAAAMKAYGLKLAE